MGRVWHARDELLYRDVALKEILFPRGFDEADKDELQQRQLREARSAARLSHPAVATVFDVVEDLGHLWIVMEFVRGRSLDSVLKEHGPLQPRVVARIGQDVLAALAAAHAVGVLHRDVKPSNVLLTRGGGAVLTDFGVATIDGDPSLTRSGMVMGTPAYSAPERIKGQPGTAASDLWSLGLTLYAASDGEGPYDNCGSVAAAIVAIATQDPAPPRNAGPNTSAIMALLSRDPAARPTAEAAIRMLAEAAVAPRAAATVPPGASLATAPPAEALSGSSSQAEASSGPSAAEAGLPAGDVVDLERASRPNHKRRRRRLVMVPVAVLVVLGASLWAVHQSGKRPPAAQALQVPAVGIQSVTPAGTEFPATTRHYKPASRTGTARTQSAAPQPTPSPPRASHVPVTQQPVPPGQSSSTSPHPSDAPSTSAPTPSASVPPPGGCGTLTGDHDLTAGQTLVSCNDAYSLDMQGDGNLVLRTSSGTTVWATVTMNEDPLVVKAAMQGDGNFALYNKSGSGVWATGTNPNDGAYLDVGNDGYVRIYSASGTVLWKSTVEG
jgi:serine/threonine protein kinase